MKIKNLKVLKGAAVVTGGIVLTIASGNLIYGNRMLFDREYDTHKVVVETYEENKKSESNIYVEHNWGLDKAISIKEPYKEQPNGKFERTVYYSKIDNYSNVELDFIKQNYYNQELLLKQDYIISLINQTKMHSIDGKYIKEEIDNIPENNNYEVSYVSFEEKLDDVIKQQYTDMELFSLELFRGAFFLATPMLYGSFCCMAADQKKKEEKEKSFQKKFINDVNKK